MASAILDCLRDYSCSLWWLSTVVNDVLSLNQRSVLSLNQRSVLQTDRSHQSGMDLSFPPCAGRGSSPSGYGHRNWVRVSRCIPLCGMSAWGCNCYTSSWPVQSIGSACPPHGFNGWGLPFRRGPRGKKLLREALEGQEVLRGVSSPPRARPYGMAWTRTPATVTPQLCHPPLRSQASLEGDRAPSCGTAQKTILTAHFLCLFFLLEIIAGNTTWWSTLESLGPLTFCGDPVGLPLLSPGAWSPVMAACTNTAAPSLWRNWEAVPTLRSTLDVLEDMRKKSWLWRAWTTVRERQQEVPPSRSVSDSVGGHKELRIAE